MKFNFKELTKPRAHRLFVPVNMFSFASFLVPIKFRQPAPARVFAMRTDERSFRTSARFNRQRLDGR